MPTASTIAIQMPSMGLISITGPDAAKFLQGQLTCDINQITDTCSQLGAYCNPQGRVYATFRIFRLQECFYLWLAADVIELVIDTLKKYVVFSKVTIHNCSDQYLSFGYLGPNAINTLATLYATVPLQEDDVLAIPEGCLINLPGKETRYLLITEAPLKPNVSTQTDLNSWQLTDIQAEIPLISKATSAEFTPHALNLPAIKAISFTKGCYVGQEIIARTQYRGQVKQHLHQITIHTAQPVKPGDTLTDHKQTVVGTIINVTEKNPSQYAALAVIQDNAIAAKDIYFADNPIDIK